MDVHDVEATELFVPLPLDEVRQRLASATSRPLLPHPTATFRGTVADGAFDLQLNRLRRHNLRPRLKGTLEAVPGGTRIHATATAPAWARPLGRGLVLLSLAMGAGIGGTLLLGGQPADMPNTTYWMLLGASAWMPVVAVALPGLLVNESVAERGLVIGALHGLFPEARAAEAEPVGLPRDQSLPDAVRARPERVPE